eukprot:1155364-Pelagomonas_calceolata.AAC.2
MAISESSTVLKKKYGPLQNGWHHTKGSDSNHEASLKSLRGTLYPMCGMNLAFDREAIGPAMYFGLMGEGQPIGRYDDMWAGWCSKGLVRLARGSVSWSDWIGNGAWAG